MKYQTLHKWHIWLGWLVGVPLILWTASGLFMVARPIEEIRGEHLRKAPLMLATDMPVAPSLSGRAVEKLTLEQRIDGRVWIIKYQGGDLRRADAATGALLPRLGLLTPPCWRCLIMAARLPKYRCAALRLTRHR